MYPDIKSSDPMNIKNIKGLMVKHGELFQNHMICSTLFHLPYLTHITNRLKKIYTDNKFLGDTALIKALQAFLWFVAFKIPGINQIDVTRVEFEKLIQLCDNLLLLLNYDSIRNFLCEICVPTANHCYMYKSLTGTIYNFTLLDLLLFRIIENPSFSDTDLSFYLETISILINYGARFSKDGQLLTLNNKGEEKYEYFKKNVIDKIDNIPNFDEFKSDVFKMNKIRLQNGAGTRRIKGTSWKKTSLRRPLIKRVTRRVLPYKGKKRSRVNRR